MKWLIFYRRVGFILQMHWCKFLHGVCPSWVNGYFYSFFLFITMSVHLSCMSIDNRYCYFNSVVCFVYRFKRVLENHNSIVFYYMEESVLLGTKPLVDSIRHFIRDPSGVFSVCHLCECRIVQWRHDSRLLLLLNWFLASRLFSLHIIKRTLHGGSKIWILCSRGKNNISLVRCAHSWDIVLATRT